MFLKTLHVLVFVTVLLVIDDVTSLSLDPVASSDLEQYIRKGDCVISMRHIRPRRKLHISIEALFMIDFPTLKYKMSFFLDRKQQRVTLDISANGELTYKHFDIPNINETTTIRSLVLHFHKSRIALLVDCKEKSAQEIDINLTNLYSQMDDPIIKLFRERKYPLHFDGNVEAALQRANCQKGLHRRGNRRMLKNKISEKEKNKKRDVRNWFSRDSNLERGSNEQYRQQEIPLDSYDIHNRGDIPIMQGDCDDALTKTLSDLMVLVKQLREDIAHQRQEIAHLRNIVENCVGCKETSNNIGLDVTCRTSNPCYPGVDCHDTSSGLRCGHCPAGMVGDGRICKPEVTCNDRPCFVGVRCHDTANGAQCESCPLGYEGDGKTCTLRNHCLDGPCPSGNVVPALSVQHYQRQYSGRKYSVISS